MKSNNQGVKEETFIQTSGRDREGQPGLRGLTARWLEDQARRVWWRGWSHICVQINLEAMGSKTHRKPRVPVQENKASNPLTIKICEGCDGGRNSQPHRRFHWRDPHDPRAYTSLPTQELVSEEPNLLVGSRKSD